MEAQDREWGDVEKWKGQKQDILQGGFVEKERCHVSGEI